MAKKIIFSNHALTRMKERSISKGLVLDAIKKPNKIEKSSIFSGRILVKKIYFHKNFKKDHLLMIICEICPNEIKIITVVDTSKISKYF